VFAEGDFGEGDLERDFEGVVSESGSGIGPAIIAIALALACLDDLSVLKGISISSKKLGALCLSLLRRTDSSYGIRPENNLGSRFSSNPRIKAILRCPSEVNTLQSHK
jgi:hypothetical protein